MALPLGCERETIVAGGVSVEPVSAELVKAAAGVAEK
jgi:hypothetical protein